MRTMKRNEFKKISDQQALQIFNRALHSKKNLRAGLSKARLSVDPIHFPSIVKSLGEKPIYRNALAQTTFPSQYDQYVGKNRLGGNLSEAGEIIWNASVLSLYQNKLNIFTKLKNQFFSLYLSGNTQSAVEILDRIEADFGVSFWLISQKIQVLQDMKGLKEQKDYLENILVTKGFWQHIGWLSYYVSLRAEEGVTYSNYKSQLQDLFQAGEVGDFAICKIIPYELPRIVSTGAALDWFETACIIDRLETLVPMLVLYAAKNGTSGKEVVVRAAELIEDTGNENILRLLSVFKNDFDALRSCDLIDLYTQGEYEKLIVLNPDNLELVARAYAASGTVPRCEDGKDSKAKIIHLMHSIITIKENLQDSKESLKKYALICYGHSYYYQIISFLERQHDHLYVGEYSLIDKICALSGEMDNPWSQKILGELAGADWAIRNERIGKDSSSFALRNALYSESGEVTIQQASWLPEYRKRAYLGHYYLKRNSYELAIDNYRFVSGLGYPYISDNIKKYLLVAYMSNNNFKEALHLVVEHVLKNPAATFIYPIKELCEKCLKEAELLSEIDLAILLHIAIKDGITEYERDISNIYENILAKSGDSIPSELTIPQNQEQKEHVVYFLKNVCVQRVMDDSTYFESVDEIDNERIRICQKLLTIDSEYSSTYLDEIRIITKDINVARLLAKVQTSKIFVDEIGIRQVLEQNLKGSLSRYKLLLESPSLAYQAEKLSRILGEMLSDKGHPEFRDLKLPATELEGLFTSMLLEVTSQFALNPAYGLDTHVSTSIRHGAFEGHLRSPLAVENLLCLMKDGIYILPSHWDKKLSKISKGHKDAILKSLSKFTTKIEGIISLYLKEKLHMETATKEGALFSFYAPSDVNKQLMDSITIKTDLMALIDIFIKHCWSLTTQSLENIQNHIIGISALQISNAFDQLSKSIESIGIREDISSLSDSIAKARTASQAAIEDVASWFQKPTDLTREPFEFEVALDVASKQILNCYLDTPLSISKNISVFNKIEGKLLDGLCEIIFILLQNVIRHGGIEGKQVDVSFSVFYSGETLIVECKNLLANEIDLDERVAQTKRSMETYERDSALRKARDEGGSGLSKVWRIAEYTLKVEHTLFMQIDNARCFSTKLELKGIKVAGT